MEATADPITLSYLDKLPLLFTPLPPFSSSASHSLASRRSGLHSNDLTTKCNTCRAEVIGGINGSYWTEKGELWLKCEGCGWATRRITDTGAKLEGLGKGTFQSVKKRRKEQERKAKEASSHPTQFRSTSKSIAPLVAATTSKSKVKDRTTNAKANPIPTPSPTLIKPASRSNSPLPSQSSRSSSAASTQPAPSIQKSVSSLPSAASSTSSSTPAVLPPPAPTSLDSKLASSKKRKRPKQPNGLAELLAKKKKDDPGSGGASGGGGLGLQDFLQGL